MSEGLPPIHDAVRFWQKNELATLSACVSFRKKPLPGWTLSWLRHAAPIIMTRELSEISLRHAVREKVFPEAQQSVLRAVELFCRFAEKHKWTGKALPPSVYELPGGASIKLELVGKYFSQLTESEWLVALQPRQEDYPNLEQFRMWRSALYHEFGGKTDSVMIVDLSRNPVSQKRELNEITARKYPLLEKTELDKRLELVASCYRSAIGLVPERPRRLIKKDGSEPGFDF